MDECFNVLQAKFPKWDNKDLNVLSFLQAGHMFSM